VVRLFLVVLVCRYESSQFHQARESSVEEIPGRQFAKRTCVIFSLIIFAQQW
jgi:hypothetical protein